MNPLLFTDPAFLFFFAPIVLTFYYLVPPRLRNAYLLTASLLLYAWGEGRNAAALIISIAINYVCGLSIARRRKSSRTILILGVTANLLLLALFKYPGFLVANSDAALALLGLRTFAVPKVRLPVGLSFFTFMAISYLVDVYRRESEAEKNPATFGLYLSMFPHLIAGPIVRFTDIAAQLHRRTATPADITEGIRRLVTGLGKKVLIGNTVGTSSDAIFALPHDQLSAPIAWIGLACYTMQIYFDFSGYSDMAIGLARMLGFRFPENFNYPYVSQSITEFWRRWHISLSTWLRDYLFFPLGVRGGRSKLYRNTLIVFLLCGLWHGAAWHFAVWGLFHGVLLVLERMGLLSLLNKTPSAVRHGYALLVVMIGWVLFRAENLAAAGAYLAAMSGLAREPFANFEMGRYLPPDVLLAMAAGVIASVPLNWRPRWEWMPAVEFGALALVFLTALAVASAGTYNPFIYFRF